MIRSLAFAVAVGFAALLSSAGAGAVPVGPASAPVAAAAAEADVLLVRDGCGRGYRYSSRRGGCVPDFDRGPPPPPRYYAPAPPPPRYYAPAPAIVLPVPRVVIPACPPGQRYSNSRRACVWR
jgi:hypothetical protein